MALSTQDIIEFLADDEWAQLGIIEGPRPSAEHEQLRGRIPDAMFEVWDTFGFCGVDRGRFWLCDPLTWQVAADAWVERLEVPMDEDSFTPLVRSAFGALECWGPRTGMSLTIYPLRDRAVPMDNSDLMAKPDDVLTSALMTLDGDSFEMFDDTRAEKPLFDRLVKKLGPVDAETMYTFTPVPALGGSATVGSASIEPAIAHILMLAGL